VNEEELANSALYDEDRKKIEEEIEEMQGFAKNLRDAYDHNYGGFLQDGMKKAGKSLVDFSKDVADNNFDGDYLKIETGFEQLDKAINDFIDKLSNSEFIDTALSKTVIPGLNLSDDQKSQILGNK
jgi:hypothetical protein